MTSPSVQLTAFSPTTNSLPKLAMEPAMYPLLFVRAQTSRARTGVRGVFGGCFISLSVELTFASESTLRNGDWRSATERACLRVSSKTGSPVVFVKSVRTTMSRSVSFGARAGERKNAAPMRRAIKKSAADPQRRVRGSLDGAGAACRAEAVETGERFGADSDPATRAARPESLSRLRR